MSNDDFDHEHYAKYGDPHGEFPSLPTREQIAEALWREENAAPGDLVSGKPWLRSSYFNQAAAVLALIHKGAGR